MKYSFIAIALVGVIITSFQNCSNVRLTRGPQSSYSPSPTSNFCLTPPEAGTRYNKILFIVDKSGSNDYDSSGTSGTGNDPQRDEVNGRRTRSIVKFFDKYKDNPYYKWGFIAFGVTRSSLIQAYVNDGSDGSPIFASKTELRSAIDRHIAVKDEGCTPYLGALQMAANAIRKDMNDHPDEDSVYNVFFMSDGKPDNPSDAGRCGTGIVSADPTSTSDPYLLAVDSVRQPDPSKIFFHTAYYANVEDATASTGLWSMAQRGKGYAVKSIGSATGGWDFDGIIVGRVPEAWKAKRMQLNVFNLNSGFCDDGSLDADSDSDGICDKDEVAYNTKFKSRINTLYPGKSFSPTNRNSFDPKYNDSFVWKFAIMPTGPGLANCTISENDKDYDFLNTCEEIMITDRNANGPYADWEIPGDHADPTNPDSDGDSYLDFHEFYNFRLESGFSAAVNFTNIFDFYADGISGETILRQHRNIKRPLVQNYNPTFTFSHINDETGEVCYSFHQDTLPVHRNTAMTDKSKLSGNDLLIHSQDENILMFYFMATPEQDPNGRGYLFHSYKKIKFDSARTGINDVLRIDYRDFRQYKVPKVTTPVAP